MKTDQQKIAIMEAAVSMTKIPLLKLDSLIKERAMYATESNYDAVAELNNLIKQLLAIEQENERTT